MSIRVSTGIDGGISENDLREFLNSDDYDVLGDENVGIIFHRTSGETLAGEQVEEERWIEFYATDEGEIYFSSI